MFERGREPRGVGSAVDERSRARPDDGTGSTSDGASAGSDVAGAPDQAARGICSERHSRAALVVFSAYLAAAFPVLLFGFGRDRWFSGDEWGFFIGRSLRDPIGLLAPENQHWSTVPIVVYQVLFKIFGLRSYLPYVGTTILLHLTLVVLIRVVMRRAGVSPWVATVVAASFVLFGTGWENILFAVQISMVGSLVFGFVHLLLADHDGPFDRRDALGLLAGLLGLMASGVAPALVVVVGLAVLIRRGWVMALIHTVPLAAIYGGWWAWQGSEEASSAAIPPVDVMGRWVEEGERGAFMALGQHWLVALALAVLLVAGLALAWVPLRRTERRVRAAAPAALFLGGVALILLVSTQRYLLGIDFSQRSHYLAMTVALTLPALGVAADAVIRRWSLVAPVVLALFLIGVPGNIRAFDDPETIGPATTEFFRGQRDFLLGVAYSPLARAVPRDVYPDPSSQSGNVVTVGFLLEARANGRLPAAPKLSTAMKDMVATRLSLSQHAVPVDADPSPIPPGMLCEGFSEPAVITTRVGQDFAVAHADSIAISIETSPGVVSTPTVYRSIAGHLVMTAQVPDLVLHVSAVRPATEFEWCTSQ